MKKNKKWSSILLAIAIIAGGNSVLASSSDRTVAVIDFHLHINGKEQSIDHFPFFYEKTGRAMVPLRLVSEKLLNQNVVNWDPVSRTAVIQNATKKIEVTVNKSIAKVNGKDIQMDNTPALIRFNKLYVPVRFIAEALGAQVTYDTHNRIVNILSNDQTTGSQMPRLKNALETGRLSSGITLDQLKTFWDQSSKDAWKKDYKTYDDFSTMVKKAFSLYDQAKVEIDYKNKVLTATLPNYNPNEFSAFVGIPDGLDPSYYSTSGVTKIKPNMKYVIPFSKIDRESGFIFTIGIVDRKTSFSVKTTWYYMDKQTGQIKNIPGGQFMEMVEYNKQIPWSVQL